MRFTIEGRGGKELMVIELYLRLVNKHCCSLDSDLTVYPSNFAGGPFYQPLHPSTYRSSLILCCHINLQRLPHRSSQREYFLFHKEIRRRDGKDMHAMVVVVSPSGSNIGSHLKVLIG
uniref:Uncharacterized protein n=1 Tax=Solanum tuberosum TaxID=4113 RepID=M1D9I7_SOLTU